MEPISSDVRTVACYSGKVVTGYVLLSVKICSESFHLSNDSWFRVGQQDLHHKISTGEEGQLVSIVLGEHEVAKKLCSENCFGLTDVEVQITWLDWPLPIPLPTTDLCQSAVCWMMLSMQLGTASLGDSVVLWVTQPFWQCNDMYKSDCIFYGGFGASFCANKVCQEGYWISMSFTHLHTNISIVDIWKHKQNIKRWEKVHVPWENLDFDRLFNVWIILNIA